MDRIVQYRQIIMQLLDEYAQYKPSNGDIEMETIFDTEKDRYQLVALGWEGKKRIYGSVIHVEIKNGKVWLQNDSTDSEIANQLAELGIPKEHIILAFYHERHRPYTGFAVN